MIEVTALLGGTAVSTLLATLAGLEGGALVLGVVTLHILTWLLLFFHAPRTSPKWRGATTAKSLVRFGGPVGLSSVLATITENIDYLVLSARMPAASVGFYWRAFTLGVTYPLRISSIMLSVALPIYSRAESADEMRRLRLRVMATHAAILFPLFVTLIVTAPILVPWLFGEVWEPSVVPTQLLAGAGMVAAVMTGGPAFIIALGKPRYLPALTGTAVIGLASAAYFAAPFGLTAVAAAVLAYYLFLLLVNHFWLLHRVGGIGLWDLFRDAIPPLIACIPLAAAGLATMRLVEAMVAAPVVVLAATIPAGLMAYAAALRLAFPRTWESLLQIARRILARRSLADSGDFETPAR
jgi:PST family polysaccharide transporter/lipopolysaccharide exporter